MPDCLHGFIGKHQIFYVEDCIGAVATGDLIVIANADDANIARLYSAALNRAPDIGGLNGWEDLYSTGIPQSAKGDVYLALAQTKMAVNNLSIAGGFTHSPEFIGRYGNLSDEGFVGQLYLNVLNRAPSSGELGAWISLMHGDAHFTREMVLVGFAESPENIAKTAADWLIQI